MDYDQFLDLPTQLKLQIIRKCRPSPYVRLRRTCRLLDEVCEKNRKHLGVYCNEKDDHYWLRVDCFNSSGYSAHLLNKAKAVNVEITKENIPKLRKKISGFLFAEVELLFNEALTYFFEAVPDLKIDLLEIRDMTAEQVQQVMESSWKVGKIHFYCPGQLRKILELKAVKNKDSISLSWTEEDTDFCEQEIIDIARGKKNVTLWPSSLSDLSSLGIVKAIVQNWKESARFPRYFKLGWDKETDYYAGDISELYGEIMTGEAVFVGIFEKRCNRSNSKWNMWIRKDEELKQWHIVVIARLCITDITCVDFEFRRADTEVDLMKTLVAIVEEMYPKNHIDYWTGSGGHHHDRTEELQDLFSKMTASLARDASFCLKLHEYYHA